MHTIVGHCPKCGSPIYAPSSWLAVIPPPSYPSCNCFPRGRTVTTTYIDWTPPQTTTMPNLKTVIYRNN